MGDTHDGWRRPKNQTFCTLFAWNVVNPRDQILAIGRTLQKVGRLAFTTVSVGKRSLFTLVCLGNQMFANSYNTKKRQNKK